jgi:methyltransferase-like protein/2-polyprenyl-3-methyl-5-hydroxy-6-metoxy-1,4-benzoquinol methylase
MSHRRPVPSNYDVVAYPGHPFIQTHPDRLAAIARLLGLQPPDLAHCRVLELACGDGGNLIPMALTMPGARFVGIDYSRGAISRGQQTIRALGLKNITLRQSDLLKLNRFAGKFDYIVTHGLYSWAPPQVGDAVLRITSENLSPHGIAYVSYNALPGGRIRQMLREMMLFHASAFDDPMERARQARALLVLIAQGTTRQDSFHAVVEQELARMSDRDLWLLFHDELGETYEPVYLHQFLAHAHKYGLEYLADANFYNLQPSALTPDAQQALIAIAPGDRVLRQQYIDFIECRRFHHTLLCRPGQSIVFPPPPERIEQFFVSTAAAPVSESPDLTEGIEEEFKGPLGSAMKTANSLAKALLATLASQSPQALSFDDLLARANAGKLRNQAREILLAASVAGLTELHTRELPLVNRVSAHPVGSPLARYQAARGEPLTTLTHATVEAEGRLELKLLPLLDGTRDHRQLLSELRSLTRKRLRRTDLETSLASLARLGFLQG